MPGSVMPYPVFIGWDDNGDVLAAGKLYTFAAGTSTPLDTYSDADLDPIHANTNPVILDSAGRAVVYLTSATYKFELKDSSDVTIWTQDNIAAVPLAQANVDIEGTAGEALSAGDCVILSDGSGGNVAGRWYLADADQTYLSSAAPTLGFALTDVASAAGGTFRISGRVTGLSSLTAGLTYYVSAIAGGLTSTPPTNVRTVGVADTTTSLIISFALTTAATGTTAGIVSLSAQTLGAGVKTFSSPPLFAPGSTAVGAGDATIGGKLYVNTTAVGNVGAGEDTLMTYPLVANTLSADGKALRILFSGTGANNGNAKTCTFYFGATTLAIFSGSTTANFKFSGTIIVYRTGAATQYIVATYNIDDGSSFVGFSKDTTAAETLSGAVTVKFTGQSGASATDDVIQKSMLVEVVG